MTDMTEQQMIDEDTFYPEMKGALSQPDCRANQAQPPLVRGERPERASRGYGLDRELRVFRPHPPMLVDTPPNP